MEAREQSPELEVRIAAPFVARIMDAPLPKEFRLLVIKAYAGTSDPRSHMTRYKAVMVMIGAEDAIMCRAFLSTLDGATQDCIQRKKSFSHLYAIRQDRGESLKDFLNKWKKEVNNVYDFDSKESILVFIQALRSEDFHRQLNTHRPRSYEDLMRTVSRYAEAEETDKNKKEEEEGKAMGKVILNQAKELGMVQFPKVCMKVSPKVDQTKYHRFHRQVGHDTNKCHILKGQIEELIQNEYFTQFVKYPRQQQGQPGNVWRKDEDPELSVSNTKKKSCDQVMK
ncbi:uncharacterized protein LOC115999486 [Ipomoea triloba]|uniref:uncharacterized protein LOC115999486 n=1 Tax=Ipomoea triloba TaxID=35885 RepID=UPI00125D482F|nr:uncharacterized protein LOC115999486 [Ipomoea triloba]